MGVDVLLGLQWGDEGKGKIVDYLARDYDIVCRFQGGPNAGHTIIIKGVEFVLHTIPSGVFRENIVNVIGNGVVMDPITFQKEIDDLAEIGVHLGERLLIAQKTHLILPTHRMLDAASEQLKGKDKIGSTLKGIGPTYMDKTGRNGLRVGDIESPQFLDKYNKLKNKHLSLLKMYPEIDFDLEKEEEQWMTALNTIKKHRIISCVYYINEQLDAGKKILAEGAQGSMLDINYGTYPYVTSSNTVTAGVCTGLGVAPSRVGKVIGILKAYSTRVGSGPFITELFDEDGAFLQKEGHEFGATTGRPRRCGWLDIPQAHYTCMLNGVTEIVLTKIDVMNKLTTIKTADHYVIDGMKKSSKIPYDIDALDIKAQYKEHNGWQSSLDEIKEFNSLPENARQYCKFIEGALKTPITIISTGPERNALIVRN